MNLKEKTNAIVAMLDENTNKSNREIVLVAGICTLLGIIIGFVMGKTSTSHDTIKKYNKCYSYDFGEEE